MPDAAPVPLIDRAATSLARWSSGIAFTLGLLGLLRRHFAGFVQAPGASVFAMTLTPLGHLVLLIAGLVGIFALRRVDSAVRYLQALGVLLLVLVLVGKLAGGASADGLAMNTRAVVVLGLLGLVALAVGIAGRRHARRPDELS